MTESTTILAHILDYLEVLPYIIISRSSSQTMSPSRRLCHCFQANSPLWFRLFLLLDPIIKLLNVISADFLVQLIAKNLQPFFVFGALWN